MILAGAVAPSGVDLPAAFSMAALAAAFAWLVWRFEVLTATGALAAGLFGLSLLVFGGASWIAAAVGFFLLSSLLSTLPKPHTEDSASSPRTARQVLANGGVAWICLAGSVFVPSPYWFIAAAGSLAAAAADTWATELGTRYGGSPWFMLARAPAPLGVSGGVSAIGLLAALVGAVSVWIAIRAAEHLVGLHGGEGPSFVTVVLSGFLGSIVDSVAGEKIQVRYARWDSGIRTDEPQSDGRANVRMGGWSGFDNDRVNWLCTIFGALFAVLLGVALS